MQKGVTIAMPTYITTVGTQGVLELENSPGFSGCDLSITANGTPTNCSPTVIYGNSNLSGQFTTYDGPGSLFYLETFAIVTIN
jgi:hypothetical protein